MEYNPSQATTAIRVEPVYPTHLLTVNSEPVTGIPFTIDGARVSTPHSDYYTEGTYTISMPSGFYVSPQVQYYFSHWEDGSTNPVRTINLTSDMVLTAYYVLPPVDTALTISAPSTVYVNQAFTVSGRLTRVDTGEGLSGMTINLYYDTVSLGSTKTDANGNYSMSVSIPTVGTYTLKAEFPGSSGYGSSYSTLTIRATSVTGPAGLWQFPILQRLANIFPWIKIWLERLKARMSK